MKDDLKKNGRRPQTQLKQERIASHIGEISLFAEL